MKRFIAFALSLSAICGLSAQKANVDQANKLAGKVEQLKEARNLIQQAMQNPETANDARTYYVAGMIELDAYDKATTAKMINPDDPQAKPAIMADEIMNAYKYFMKALPLDSLPDDKGKIKPKYSKEINNKIIGHASDFFTAGANYFNEKMYYPQAYEAFIVYANLPAGLPEEQIATAYFNAGLSAYSGDSVDNSAEAFKQARLKGYDQPEAYIYEIACWQAIASRDSSRDAEAQEKIKDVAKAGHEKFGLEKPIFINNLINSYVLEGNMNEAITILNGVISENPDNANLYGLRGFVYDRLENNDMSEADYRKAASFESADFDTLLNAGKKIFRIGTSKWNEIEGASAEASAARQNVKTNYFDVAKSIADKASKLNGDDPDLDSLTESIDYVLETYF